MAYETFQIDKEINKVYKIRKESNKEKRYF